MIKRRGGRVGRVKMPDTVHTQVLAVRLDPKLKFGVALAARAQHRSMTSFVEWQIARAVRDAEVEGLGKVTDLVEKLWDYSELERLRRMKKICPSLMTYEETTMVDLDDVTMKFPPRRKKKGGEE